MHDGVWSIRDGAEERLGVELQQRLTGLRALETVAQEARPRLYCGRAGRPAAMSPGAPGSPQESLVAVFPISGGIFRWSYLNNPNQIANDLTEAAMAPGVIAVVLRIDCYGGEVTGFAPLFDAVGRLRAQGLGIYAQVEGECCSLGYWLACACDAIFAERSALVGSIGVRKLVFDTSKMMSESKVRVIAIDTGPYKSAGAPGLEITEEQIAHWREIIASYFAMFGAAVKEARGMSAEQFAAVSDGRYWTAETAKGLGLIDGVQGFGDTLSQVFSGESARRLQSARGLRARMLG